jgi:hypothetical protein
MYLLMVIALLPRASINTQYNLVPRAFPFLLLGRREKALAPGGLLCILIGQ